MLRTGKQVWEASAKRSALGIRQEELTFHLDRYTMLITQSSVLAGFAFESIVHLEVPEELKDSALASWFFGSLALAVLFSVYVVVIGSCLVVLGHQLALLGEDGDSLELAVKHMRGWRVQLFVSGFAALLALLSAGAALAWIKMGPIAGAVSVCFAIFGFLTFSSVTSISCAIGDRPLVTGETKFFTPNGYFDLAMLQPGTGVHATADASALADRQRRAQAAQDVL